MQVKKEKKKKFSFSFIFVWNKILDLDNAFSLWTGRAKEKYR